MYCLCSCVLRCQGFWADRYVGGPQLSTGLEDVNPERRRVQELQGETATTAFLVEDVHDRRPPDSEPLAL